MANELTREQIDRAESRWDSSDYLAASEATALFAMARAYLSATERQQAGYACAMCPDLSNARAHAKAWKRLAKGLRRDVREACDDYESSEIYLHNAERDLAAARAALGRCRDVMRSAIQCLDVAMAHGDMGEVETARDDLAAALKGTP